MLTRFPFATRGLLLRERLRAALRCTCPLRPIASEHGVSPMAQDRLTPGQMLFPGNPAPSVRLQGSHLNICYYHQDLH